MAFSKPKAFERAERYAAKGQHDKAAREYQAIVEHDPKDVRAWLMLADCLVRTGDRAGAITRYERVAGYYVEARETNKALAVYRQVLNLDPNRLDVQTKVAALHLAMGNVQDGVAVYERIAARHMQNKRVADALATYKLVADADPTAVARRLRLAELYSREKKTAEAVEAFRVAAKQLHDDDRIADYVRVAERLLYHDGSDLPTVRGLARAYLQLGDPRRALMKLNGLLRSNPEDEEGIELLAETFMGLGKPEKALSALEELARALREKGPEAKDETIRILRRGLKWRPGHAEFAEALAELEGRRTGAQRAIPAAAPAHPSADDAEDFDLETLDESDLVELDEDDLVLEEPGAADQVSAVTPSEPAPRVTLPGAVSSAPGTRQTKEVEAVPSAEPSLTQSVLSEVDGTAPEPEGLTDFDKILFEARVYIKYRLFEHALDHVQTALRQQPQHIGALSLQARALTELSRVAEAADVHVVVAQLVARSDPKLAREHLEAARGLVPDHAGADEVGALLPTAASSRHSTDEVPTVLVGPASGDDAEPSVAAPNPDEVVAEGPADQDSVADALPAILDDEGDSGAFDLVSAGESAVGLPVVSAAESGHGLEPEPAANLVDAHDGADDDDAGDPESTQPFAPVELDEDDDEIELALDDDDELPPAQTGRTLTPFGQPGEFAPGEASPLGNALQDGAPSAEGDLDLPVDDAVPHSLVPGAPIPIDDDDDDELVTQPVSVPIETGPAVAPPPGGWPDLSDDLAEVRFYLDQGLDDDAEAALADLEERHPGHPEIAAFRGPAPTEGPAAIVEAEAAQPLFDVDASADAPLVNFDEDEDGDDYLSAIFAEPSESEGKSGARKIGDAGANVAEGQSVDAATAFDLGVAYREMGLVDTAITQFETAAADPTWRARALTMLGSLRVHQGDSDAAVAHLREAVEVAVTPAEASEAAYELAALFEMLGDAQAAAAQFEQVAPGYRDRDQRLAALRG